MLNMGQPECLCVHTIHIREVLKVKYQIRCSFYFPYFILFMFILFSYQKPYTQGSLFLNLVKLNQMWIVVNTFLIYLKPNRIPFGAKSMVRV